MVLFLCWMIDCDKVCSNSIAVMETSTTSAVSIIEDVHCKLREEQRRISKVDLAAAMKYGKKSVSITPSGPNEGVARLMFEYRGTTYITDSKGERQVTCWAKGLTFPELPIEPEREEHLREHRDFLKKYPSNISSHIVFVVDQSGSMKLSDVPGARNRHFAVFSSILLDYILPSIVEEKADSGHDVMTIMDMRDTTKIILHREPLDELTYYKVVRLMNNTTPGGQGNFIPAFARVHELLAPTPKPSERCVPDYSQTRVQVVFLTDGRPSDKKRQNAWSGLFPGHAV